MSHLFWLCWYKPPTWNHKEEKTLPCDQLKTKITAKFPEAIMLSDTTLSVSSLTNELEQKIHIFTESEY